MPYIHLQLPVSVTAAEQAELLPLLSGMIARETGKPEQYCMAAISTTAFIMAGRTAPAAFADIRGIGGFDSQTNGRISAALCSLLEEKTDISKDRIYMNFTDISRENWGWKGHTL